MGTREQTETGGDMPRSPEATKSPSPDFSFTPPLLPDKNIAHLPPPSLELSPPPPAGDVISRRQLLSFLRVSPRSSPNSTDSFALARHTLEAENGGGRNRRALEGKEKKKSKSISWALGLMGKWRKRSDRKIEESKEKETQKRYSRILEALLRRWWWRWRRRSKGDSEELMRHGYSVSVNATLSAAAVMRSPSPAIAEELQGAIESAIAHCKNSIAVGEQHRD